MAVPEASKERIGVYIAYTPARRVINLPGALGSYFQPIRFIPKFILKLFFTFHSFCVEQLLFTLHASLSCSMCMCHNLSCHGSVYSWHPMMEHDLLVCMLCSCKKGMVDVNSLKQEMLEVAISLLNSVCFCCCTVLQQAKAFPCK